MLSFLLLSSMMLKMPLIFQKTLLLILSSIWSLINTMCLKSCFKLRVCSSKINLMKFSQLLLLVGTWCKLWIISWVISKFHSLATSKLLISKWMIKLNYLLSKTVDCQKCFPWTMKLKIMINSFKWWRSRVVLASNWLFLINNLCKRSWSTNRCGVWLTFTLSLNTLFWQSTQTWWRVRALVWLK